MKRVTSVFLAASLALFGGATAAQSTYPDKPVRYILPFAPGGESDIGARLQGLYYKKKFGQELIVEGCEFCFGKKVCRLKQFDHVSDILFAILWHASFHVGTN